MSHSLHAHGPACDFNGPAEALWKIRRAARWAREAFWDATRLVVRDPFDRRPRSFRGALAQMRDIVLHEFWMAAERPHRSPGAQRVPVRKQHFDHVHLAAA